MTVYRTTVPLPKRAAFYNDRDHSIAQIEVLDKLREVGAVLYVRKGSARWEVESSDEYELANTVRDMQTEIAWAYDPSLTIERPKKVKS